MPSISRQRAHLAAGFAVCLGVATAWGQFGGDTTALDSGENRGSVQPEPWADSGAGAMSQPVFPVAATPRNAGTAGSDAGLEWKILENPNSGHAAVVFDPVRRVLAVYHVDASSGEIMLRAVRSLAADLELEQYQTTPAPRDIRKMHQERRD